MIPTFTQRLTSPPDRIIADTLSLTAEERQRSRHRFATTEGQEVYLNLPRGTSLRHGDILSSEAGDRLVQVIAQPEPVLTVTASQPLQLLQAAYHLGNRHVPLEITATYLRLAPDPVLQNLLEHRGLQVREELAPFQPESGAYGHSHAGHT